MPRLQARALLKQSPESAAQRGVYPAPRLNRMAKVSTMKPSGIVDFPQWRDRTGVFLDRVHAGRVLAKMLHGLKDSNPLILPIPAGGIPVGVTIARELNLALDIAVVSKITLPWNTESGYGAVAFDGTTHMNEELLRRLSLSDEEIYEGIAKTWQKVRLRVTKLRGGRPLPGASGRTIILVDDGLASGTTMEAAIKALRKVGAQDVAIAVPTAHWEAAQRLAGLVEAIYCPNIRSGRVFAVADAYRSWSDLSDTQAEDFLRVFIEGK
jgi:putative phosphoribosyl transferase